MKLFLTFLHYSSLRHFFLSLFHNQEPIKQKHSIPIHTHEQSHLHTSNSNSKSPRRKMNFLPLPSPSMSFLFHVSLILILLLIGIPPSLTNAPGYLYNNCGKGFNCGDQFKNINYPFWGGDGLYGCGHPDFQLKCYDGYLATIEITKVIYRVIEINANDQTLKIARHDYFGGVCTAKVQNYNTTVDPTLYEYGSGYSNVTILYGCPASPTDGFKVSGCPNNGLPNPGVYVWPGSHGPGICSTGVVVPVETDWVKAGKFAGLDQVLKNGFKLKWKVESKGEACSECTKSGGKCGYDIVTKRNCFCLDENFGVEKCRGKNSIALPLGLGIGGAAIAGLFLGFLFFYARQRKKQQVALSKSKDLSTPPSSKGLTTPTTKFSSTTPSYFSSQSTDLEKGGSTYFGVQVFSYTELEEATNNFDSARELGDGGFGTVYYGNLQDGRVVAVKRLYENNFKRVEQFMNEVEILTRLRHPNLVLLYGCTSRRSRELLLVYEYIPNGTVADHLHGKKTKSGLLTWPIRLSIAIETADALAYLHRSDIIHRDVKTNNILLDNNFQVKVADFGLSRLFPTDCTHVSTAPQGTPGYVDPEYYQCYQLTDKSDVYSFGVVLVELISSLEAVDTNRHRHDINLSNMAVSKIQNQALHELVDPSLGFETDSGVRRMTTVVAELAFRCLQQERDMRPSMVEVLETLKGIEKEEFGESKAEVVDIRSDDVGLLKNVLPPPFSPDSVVIDKWVSSSTPPSSF